MPYPIHSLFHFFFGFGFIYSNMTCSRCWLHCFLIFLVGSAGDPAALAVLKATPICSHFFFFFSPFVLSWLYAFVFCGYHVFNTQCTQVKRPLPGFSLPGSAGDAAALLLFKANPDACHIQFTIFLKFFSDLGLYIWTLGVHGADYIFFYLFGRKRGRRSGAFAAQA